MSLLISETCGKPPDVDDAIYEPKQDKYPSGAQVQYECGHGYFAEGEPHAMCNSDGQWVGLLLACTRKYSVLGYQVTHRT